MNAAAEVTRAQSAFQIVAPARAIEIPRTATSRPFGAADRLQEPTDLAAAGYEEAEFAVSGAANVYDWAPDGALAVRHEGLPYTTRILVRRPKDASRFSGTVLVDIGNRGAGFDTFAVWGQLGTHLLDRGDAYVAVTVFANNVGALKMFDRARYGSLSFPAPPERCGAARGDAWKRPPQFFPASEDAVRWDVISQVGALLKTAVPSNPLGRYRVDRVYASMQSGGDLPTYINAFSRRIRMANGEHVYDAFLIKDSGGPRMPLNDCAQPLAAGDGRRTIANGAVPVMQIVTQNSISAAIRRPDSDAPGDEFRLYEVPGTSHFDRWQYNYPASDDLAAAGVPPLTDHWTFPSECRPHRVALNDFPLPALFAGAFDNLDAWTRRRTPPPVAPRIEVVGGAVAVDAVGNARGGVRTPWVDLPTAVFHEHMEGPDDTPFRCDDNGYWTPLSWSRLEQLYGTSASYTQKFDAEIDRLVADRWINRDAAQMLKQRRMW